MVTVNTVLLTGADPGVLLGWGWIDKIDQYIYIF